MRHFSYTLFIIQEGSLTEGTAGCASAFFFLKKKRLQTEYKLHNEAQICFFWKLFSLSLSAAKFTVFTFRLMTSLPHLLQ